MLVSYAYSRQNYFRRKHVFITGASSGIGKALAIYLATKKGARVSLAARSVDKLEHICRVRMI
jgi:NADP-dependent 3-hydroxy acid dehydrogenase YdfG